MFGIWSICGIHVYQVIIVTTMTSISAMWKEVVWALTTRVDASRNVLVGREHSDRLSHFASPVAGARIEDGDRRYQQIDRRKHRASGAGRSRCSPMSESSRPTLEGPRSLTSCRAAVRPGEPAAGPAPEFENGAGQDHLPLARPEQGPAGLGLHASPTLPEVLVLDAHAALAIEKILCSEAAEETVSLNWRPGCWHPRQNHCL